MLYGYFFYRLRPEDVGYDLQSAGGSQGVGGNSIKSLSSTQSDTDGDPLVSFSIFSFITIK